MTCEPCLCGYPYCGVCGNPGMEKIESYLDELSDAIFNSDLTEEDFQELQKRIPETVEKIKSLVRK